MRYKTVIFDVDGTLFDTSPGIFKCIRFVLKSMNYPDPGENLLRSFIGPPVFESFSKICKMSDEEAQRATQMYRSAYVEKFIGCSSLYEGMDRLLETLKSNGIKTGIATMKTHPQINRLLKIFNLANSFDSISAASPDIKKSKADIINEVLTETDTLRKDAVMIGDSMYDAEGAKNAGIDFIAVSYGFGISSEQQLKAAKVPYAFYAENVEMLDAFLL